MVDFRRWILAAAVLALFTGLASAQVPGGPGAGGVLSCTASVAVPPQLRSEGMTELIGDIVLTCTGGAQLTSGSVIPVANITVSLGTNVTSRILTAGAGAGNVSEAMLLIDEPGSGLVPVIAGTGPGAPQTPCTVGGVFPLVGAGPGGCVQVANNVPVSGGSIPVALSQGGGAPANMFLGVVNANQVTFAGIPILAPVTTGSSRVFRITNIRANVAGLGGGGLSGTTQMLASISISGSTALPVNNPVQIAGFIQAGLSTSLRNANNSGGLSGNGAGFNQCNTTTTGGVAILQYTENFGTAFKTRVAPTSAAAGSGQLASVLQNIPGTIYNSESGFIVPPNSFGVSIGGVSVANPSIGLADYGTRLKAVFNNIPAGVRIFVSATNLLVNTANATIAPPAGNSTSSFAQLITSEVAPDGNGTVPTVVPTASVNGNPGTTALYELPQSGGSATAVWEVVNTNPSANETFNFGVWTSYTANPGSNSPAVGTATVNQSYAPTPTAAFSATAGSSASSSLTIPRFADTSSAKNLLVINICQTLLLFPYVTNVQGLDTGLAISNTSSDPIGTTVQNGTCKYTFYDGSGKPAPFTTANIATGTVDAHVLSEFAPGFTGYAMALCNFQYAHGFAFISDIGLRNISMGYLALIVNNGGLSRPNAPAAESLAH